MDSVEIIALKIEYQIGEEPKVYEFKMDLYNYFDNLKKYIDQRFNQIDQRFDETESNIKKYVDGRFEIHEKKQEAQFNMLKNSLKKHDIRISSLEKTIKKYHK